MRARNIKPGFFKNEELAECDPLARLLFAGLWGLADRDGILEDRPKKIKAEILPYDNCDIDKLLQQLNENGFILRYNAGGIRGIQILKFGQHQKPHNKEPRCGIPAPQCESKFEAVNNSDSAGNISGSARKVSGQAGQDELGVEGPNSPCALNPESGILNPSSGMMKPSPGKDGESVKAAQDQKQAEKPAERGEHDSNLPCHNPDRLPIASRVVKHYQGTVKPGHSLSGAEAAVIGLLKSGHNEIDLCLAATRYAQMCNRQNTEARYREKAAKFYGEGGFQAFLADNFKPPTERPEEEDPEERARRNAEHWRLVREEEARQPIVSIRDELAKRKAARTG